MARWSFGDVTGSETLSKALRAKRERLDAIAFYSSLTKNKQKIRSQANLEVITALDITNGYLFRLLIVANSPEFVHQIILDDFVAADTVVDIHFYLKKKLKRSYTVEELKETYDDLLALMAHYKKSKLQPLLVEKFFQYGKRYKNTGRYKNL